MDITKKQVIKTIFIANMVVAIVIRAFHDGRVDIADIIDEKGVLNIRIAGVNSQPETAFKFIEMPEEGTNVEICYSPFGFNARSASNQVENLIERCQPEQVNIFSVSIGTQVAQNLDETICSEATTVVINPFSNRSSLRKGLRALTPATAILAEVITVPLGCVGFLPVIPAESGQYSAVLWADLLFSAGFYNPDCTGADIAIWSDADELLDKTVFDAQYDDSVVQIVKTNHARIGDQKISMLYQEAIDKAWHELKNLP